MPLLVTSAAGANGAGYGKILVGTDDGKPTGVFGDDPRIVDPRGLGIDPADAAPDHWRHLHNRLVAGVEPRPYSGEQHRAWLLRRRLVP